MDHRIQGLMRDLEQELDRLKTQWSRLHAPIADRLRPGLTEDVAQSMAAEHGLVLPPELVAWWGWHDGAEVSHTDIGPGGYRFISLAAALAQYEDNLEVHSQDGAPELVEMGLYWHRTWLPFAVQGAQRLYVDVDRQTASNCSPVRLVTWEWEDFDVDHATSVRSLVARWRWLLETDYYIWRDGQWDFTTDYQAIPEPLRGYA